MRRLASTSRVVPLGLGIVTLLVFLPALPNRFVWDDVPDLVANRHGYRRRGPPDEPRVHTHPGSQPTRLRGSAT
jgi:hypothetical protein